MGLYRRILSDTACLDTPARAAIASNFAVSLGKQLAKLDIDTLPTIGRKELLIVKKQPCAVYPVMFSSLRPNESLILQSQGLGGRNHLGCGFFE